MSNLEKAKIYATEARIAHLTNNSKQYGMAILRLSKQLKTLTDEEGKEFNKWIKE